MKSNLKFRISKVSLPSLFFLIAITTTLSQPDVSTKGSEYPNLSVFSVSAAGRWISSGNPITEEIRSVGHISRIWAAIVDGSGDLLLVGERDPDAPCIQISDVCTALRTYKNASISKTSPGVSIGPIDTSSYVPYQKVSYFGGIENTHYGRVVLEADILLKLLSNGLISPDVDSLPSLVALQLYRHKAAMIQDPWLSQQNNAWFYPVSIGRKATDSCMVITHTTLKVFDAQDPVSKLDSLVLNLSNIFEYLNEYPENVSPLFSALISMRYEDLERSFPVLAEMKNLLGLSALFSGLFETIEEYNGKWFWETVFDAHDSHTPELLPAINFAENGLAYSFGISGGIISKFQTDPWTILTLQRTPDYLKQGATFSRPEGKDPISWMIPLGYGKPDEWNKDLIKKLNDSENQRIEDACHKDRTTCTCTNQQDLLDAFEKNFNAPPIVNVPGWNPPTSGEHVLYFGGNFLLNTGGQEIYDPDRILSIGSSDLSTGVLVKAGLILKNRLEFRLELPFIQRVQLQDEPSNLPGLSNTYIQLKGGLESPTFRIRALLMDGIKKGRFIGTSLIFDNSITPRLHWKWYSLWLTGSRADDNFLPFGQNETITSHALNFSQQLGQQANLQFSIAYLRTWFKEQPGANVPNSSFLLTPSVLFNAGKESRFLLGLKAAIGYRLIDIDRTSSVEKAFRNANGWVLSGVMAFPRNFGNDSFSLGWYFPNKAVNDQTRGGFVLEVNLDGSRLWDKRKWFNKPKK